MTDYEGTMYKDTDLASLKRGNQRLRLSSFCCLPLFIHFEPHR